MGREFIPLFDEWAEFYEETVSGHDPEYKEVFERYEQILESVAAKSYGTVLEFGVGTGNLTEILIRSGRKVIGVEPSKVMREKTRARFLDLELLDGDFLTFPELPEQVDCIVSTYAFHHLTDAEKEEAIFLYKNMLGDQGKIIFADTAFQNEEERQERLRIVQEKGYLNLLDDLQREYYSTLDVLEELFIKNGFKIRFEKMNSYVWLMEAVKEK